MEKFGLFDLINKFNLNENANSSFANDQNQPQNPQNKNGILKDPDFFAPPQYMMNAKMSDFVAKHDALSEKIRNSLPPSRPKQKSSTSQKTEKPQ